MFLDQVATPRFLEPPRCSLGAALGAAQAPVARAPPVWRSLARPGTGAGPGQAVLEAGACCRRCMKGPVPLNGAPLSSAPLIQAERPPHSWGALGSLLWEAVRQACPCLLTHLLPTPSGLRPLSSLQLKGRAGVPSLAAGMGGHWYRAENLGLFPLKPQGRPAAADLPLASGGVFGLESEIRCMSKRGAEPKAMRSETASFPWAILCPLPSSQGHSSHLPGELFTELPRNMLPSSRSSRLAPPPPRNLRLPSLQFLLQKTEFHPPPPTCTWAARV